MVSDDINVAVDERGATTRVQGSFYASYATESEARTPAEIGPEPGLAGDAISQAFNASPLGKLIFRLNTNTDVFELQNLNQAAAIDYPSASSGQSLLELGEFGVRFDVDAALRRVGNCGIAEAHQVPFDAADQVPCSRSYHFARTEDGSVLLEYDLINIGSPRDLETGDNESFWEQVVKSLPDLVVLLDDNAVVEQIIAGHPIELGVSSEALIGQSVSVMLGEQSGAECKTELVRTLNTGKPARFSARLGDGDATRWLECRLSPLKNVPGTNRRVLWTASDISERVRAIDEISFTRQQFRDALYRVPAALYLKDIDGRYLLVNPHFEALYGIEEELIAGKTDYEVFPDELATEIYSADRQVLETLEPFEQLVTIGSVDARRRYRSFSFPVCDAGGDITGVCCLLIAQDRFLTDVADGADHEADDEMREITATVIGRVEQAVAASENCLQVLGALERLSEATAGALALIRPFTDPVEDTTLAPMQALPLVKNLLDIEQILLPRQATLHRDLADELPEIHAHPAMFQRLLLHSLRHARSHIRGDGTLTIKLRHTQITPRGCASCMELVEGDFVELVVEESQSRLSDQDLHQLFNAPTKQAQTNSRQGNLSEVHRLIHTLGGHLLVQQGVPNGISLYLLFPCLARDLQKPVEPGGTVTRLPIGKQSRD